MFVAEGESRTNGELSSAEKDRISHRGKAVRDIVPVLLTELGKLGGTP
jgi:XTP/dITP diphosphohydrolase